MFGFFGKKKKQQEPAPEPEEKKAEGTEHEEFQEFAAAFEPETLELMALTGPNGFNGEQEEGQELWTLGVSITAWLEQDVSDVHQGDYQLVTKGDETLRDYLRRRIPGDFILKFRGRLEKDGGTRILMVNLPEPAFDAELKAIQEEQKKPVSFWEEGLGTFELARSVGWFVLEVEWQEETVDLTFNKELDRAGCVETAKGLMNSVADWDEKIRAALAEQFDGADWLEDADLSGAELAEQVMMDSIQVDDAGGFQFWFSHEQIPEGQAIHLTGTLESGVDSVALEA